MKISRIAFLFILFCMISCRVWGADIDLQFSVWLDADTNMPVFPDRFTFLSSTQSDPNNLLYTNLLIPPPPPGRDFLRIRELNNPASGVRQHVTHEPNSIEVLYTLQLEAYDEQAAGLNGTNTFSLENPEALDVLDEQILIYLRRFDDEDSYIQNYNLRDTDNHSIEWQVTASNGTYAVIEIIAEDKRVAANLDGLDWVDFFDFAATAASWQSEVPLYGTDVYRDGFMDTTDLKIMTEVWLMDSAK